MAGDRLHRLLRLGRLHAAAALVVLAAAPAVAADQADQSDQSDAIVDSLAAGRPYVEAQAAGGDQQLWTDRLSAAAAEQRFGAPVHVALWVPSPGGPEPQGVLAAAESAGDADGVYLLGVEGYLDTEGIGLADRDLRRALDLDDRAASVLAEALRLSGRDPDTTLVLPVAQAWVWLRLAAPDPPAGPALARELADDPSVLGDSGYYQPGFGNDDPVDPTSVTTLVIVGLVLLAYAGVRVLIAVRARPTVVPAGAGARAAPAAPVTPVEAATADTRLQDAVTGLAEAIGASDARPGQLSYDRAQSCLDAASWYADHGPLGPRERLGVELLAADGRSWLGGRPPSPRCYFNPEHRLSGRGGADAVVHAGTSVPCCARCARAVRAGDEPDVLRLEGRPYFTRDDVWSQTGYGSLSSDWAEQVLRDATEDR